MPLFKALNFVDATNTKAYNNSHVRVNYFDSLKKYHENFRHGYGLHEWAAWRTSLNDRLIYHTIMSLNAANCHDTQPFTMNLSSLDINDMLNSINVNPQLSNFISSLSCFKDSSFIDFDSLIMFGLPRVFLSQKDLRLNENNNNNNYNNNIVNNNMAADKPIDNNANPPPLVVNKETKSKICLLLLYLFFYFRNIYN